MSECDKPTYVSSSTDEDGTWQFLAECDGMPVCGFEYQIPEDDIAEVIFNKLVGFYFTSEDMAKWDRAHRAHPARVAATADAPGSVAGEASS